MNPFWIFKKAVAPKVDAALQATVRADSVGKIARSSGALLSEDKGAWHLMLSRDEIEFRVTIPTRAREWFVSAYVNGETAWSDDDDSYATNEESEEVLERRFISAIEAFLTKLKDSEIRYLAEPTIEHDFRKLQWRQDSNWTGVSLS